MTEQVNDSCTANCTLFNMTVLQTCLTNAHSQEHSNELKQIEILDFNLAFCLVNLLVQVGN